MMARSWPIERMAPAEVGGASLAYQIRCGGCGGLAYYPLKRGVKKRTPESILQHFRGYGWDVGRTARLDRCPECLKRNPLFQQETKPMTTSQKGPAANVVALKADAPPTMTPADRQIVFARIGDFYSGHGYTQGWTDKKVGADLNVPVAWVREIRDMMFGPEGSNPLLDEFLKGQAAFEREVAIVLESRKQVCEAAERVRRSCDDLSAKARDLDVLKKRVEKEIGR
ncbi:hypothetical protein [Rhizobium sp. Root482]|uniref:hypothetical protein n=1 Tax=Rhizobium sp. Root482 TaxID=1736543 RepID=UPI0006F39D99|nr:hypothetical protein [Rhizobium sp. Root482]KQY27196.1 hypothetical protein ASD31_03155 [Rhizobium sp. Root482]